MLGEIGQLHRGGERRREGLQRAEHVPLRGWNLVVGELHSRKQRCPTGRLREFADADELDCCRIVGV